MAATRPNPLSALFLTSLLVAGTAPASEPPVEAPTRDPEKGSIATGVWTSEDGSKVTYESQYFEAYQAVTAADMLRWVPGGAELIPDNRGGANQNDKRGFGSGGDQVLINGKRLSGKSNDIGSALQRIQAGVVSRVEVIRGTTAGLDVRSEGTLINIVLDGDITGGAGSWQLHSGFYGRDEAEFDGLLSYSNTAGRLTYLVSLQRGPYNRGNQIERFDEFFAPDGTLTERRDIEVPMLNEETVFNSTMTWAFDSGSILNVNGRINDRSADENETTRVFTTGSQDVATLRNLSQVEGLDWELGGDLEQGIGPGTLKTRLIYTSKDENEAERVSLTSTDPGNVPAESLVQTDSLATEAILRSSYRWTLPNGQTMEAGLEGARNTLEKDVALFEVLADGSLQPVDVFNANSDVNEDRYEFFSTHFWQARSNVVLESALNVEYSKIAQEGLDVENARSFTYVKPRFDLRWDLSDANQVRTSLERTISQLDFSDFVASFDNENDQVDAGNPDLEPEKAWELKLAYERRLANDRGLLAAQFFYNDIEDHIDNIRVTDTVSAAGNIGAAENYGLELKGSLRLASIGLEGAVLDASYTVQESETTDPFSGRKRDMSDKQAQEYSISFRHDIAKWKFNYDIEIEWNGERSQNDINYRETSKSVNPRTHVSMQYRLTDRILLWFDTRIVFDGHNRRVRDRYVGNVADGNLLRTEVRNQYFRREHIIGLRGQF